LLGETEQVFLCGTDPVKRLLFPGSIYALASTGLYLIGYVLKRGRGSVRFDKAGAPPCRVVRKANKGVRIKLMVSKWGNSLAVRLAYQKEIAPVVGEMRRGARY
jgi:hypothetical protein